MKFSGNVKHSRKNRSLKFAGDSGSLSGARIFFKGFFIIAPISHIGATRTWRRSALSVSGIAIN